jgi:hypothetical protein
MPTRKTRAGTPLRTGPPKDKLVELCLDMEDALDQVVDVAHALRLIGHGLGHGLNQSAADEQEGRAVAAVASSACERLDTLRQACRNLCKFTLRTGKP